MSMSEGQSPATLKLRAFIDAVLAIAWSALPDGSLDFINERFREYTGLSSDRLIGWEWKSVVHPDDLQKLGTWWQDVRQSQEAGTTEKRLRRFDGAYRWFRVAAAPVRDEQANLVRWCGINTDIDDLKCSEQKFRDEAANFRTITDAIRQSITVLAPDGMRLYANQVFREVTGLTISEVNDKTFLTRVFHPDDLNRVVAERQEGLLREAPFEFEARVLMNGGQYRWGLIQYNPLKDERGQIIRWYSTGTDIDDRKRAEQELKRSEADLLEAQRLTQTCSWKHDIPSGRVSVSPEALRMFGVNSGEDTSDAKCWFGKIHPEDRSRTQSLFEKSENEKTSYEADYRVVLPDGSIRYQHSVGRPVLNGSGELVEFIGTAVDVTEQVQSKAALQKAFDEIEKSEAKLRQAIDTIPALAWCNLPDGPNEFLNKGWHEYTGLTPEESHGWGWQVAFHPEDLPPLMKRWREMLVSGEPGETEARLRRHDGVYRWFLIRAQPLCDEVGKIVRWYGTSTDIDDRKRAEQKLRESEETLRTMIDAVRQYITVLALDGKVLYTNRVALDLTGLTVGEVNDGGFFPRAFHPDDVTRVRAERQENLLRGTPFDLQMRLRFKNGQYRWQLFQYNPLIDESGQIIRWYCTATDIDDQKRTEERLRNENLVLREEINSSSMFEDIVGSSEPLRRVLMQVSKVAPSDSTVLILGETGTGKELIARAIHKRSSRASRAFIGVNCAAIPPSLIASELFGHEKGAFTGATQRRLGRFETANDGTIFLDEIGDLPADIQIALLRVLQEREIERVGSDKPIPVDVRVVAATNRDLNALVSEGKFRQDLLYRLNVVPIQMPSLRERAADIPLLVEYFIARFGSKAGKKFRTIDKRTLRLLQAYQWPGNVRELQNVIERAVILADSDCFAVDETWFKRERSEVARPGVALAGVLLKQEKELIETALREARGVVGGPTGAAAKLGIPRETLNSKIRKLGIKRSAFRAS